MLSTVRRVLIFCSLIFFGYKTDGDQPYSIKRSLETPPNGLFHKAIGFTCCPAKRVMQLHDKSKQINALAIADIAIALLRCTIAPKPQPD
jgi:hypothetical protein